VISPGRSFTEASFSTNLRMTKTLAAAIRRRPVAHLTYVSSEAVYPWCEGGSKLDEASAPAPADAYGAMHLAREECLAPLEDFLPVAVVRPVMLLGADDQHNAYGPNRFVREALRSGRVTLFGEGEDIRDYVLVDDFCRVIQAVIACAGSGVLNVASGEAL